jgi:phenylpropionate dioxygenase-like ring-hydroxylating dioxygenase large terminal subunit
VAFAVSRVGTTGGSTTRLAQSLVYPIDVDRTRFLCWQLIYDGDLADPDYADYHQRTMRRWDRLKQVVGQDIEIYEQLERTKRSSDYTQHVLQGRECKIANYHENMNRKIQSPPGSSA